MTDYAAENLKIRAQRILTSPLGIAYPALANHLAFEVDEDELSTLQALEVLRIAAASAAPKTPPLSQRLAGHDLGLGGVAPNPAHSARRSFSDIEQDAYAQRAGKHAKGQEERSNDVYAHRQHRSMQ